jgi:hypothetical protein
LGIGVVHHQFWRQLHCRPPAVQLLAQLPRRFQENHLNIRVENLQENLRDFKLSFAAFASSR